MERKSLPLVIAMCLACLAGCSVNEVIKLEGQLRDRDRQITQLNEQLEAAQRESAARQKQIEQLQALGEKRLEQLFHVERVAMGRHTAGYDTDGKSGDDGVRVYLQPFDQHGSVIKAAGDVTIQLYDLALPAELNRLAECKFSAKDISSHWASGFLTYHYALDCPWSAGPPKHDEITVRVEFTDYLTGRQFTVQQVVKVKLPT